MWQPCGFILKSAKTEARSAGLGDNKASVFEQQFLRLNPCAFRDSCCDFFEIKWPGIGLACSHA